NEKLSGRQSEFNRCTAVYLSGSQLSDLRSDGPDFWFFAADRRSDRACDLQNSSVSVAALVGYGCWLCRTAFRIFRLGREQGEALGCGADADQYGVLYQFNLLGQTDQRTFKPNVTSDRFIAAISSRFTALDSIYLAAYADPVAWHTGADRVCIYHDHVLDCGDAVLFLADSAFKCFNSIFE